MIRFDEQDRVAESHFKYYLKVAGAGREQIALDHQKLWLDRIDKEIANYRAALAWAMERDAVQAMKMAVAMSFYWQIRGYISEGLGWLLRLAERIVDAKADAETAAPLLERAAIFATMQDDYEKARQLSARSRDSCMHGWTTMQESVVPYMRIGVIDHRTGSSEQARKHYTEALEHLKKTNNNRLISVALANLASLDLDDGDVAEAQRKYSESLRCM